MGWSDEFHTGDGLLLDWSLSLFLRIACKELSATFNSLSLSDRLPRRMAF